MKKQRKKLLNIFYNAHYFLTCLELWLWKQWAGITQLIKHRKLPRKRTPKELEEASALLRKWLERDRTEKR